MIGITLAHMFIYHFVIWAFEVASMKWKSYAHELGSWTCHSTNPLIPPCSCDNGSCKVLFYYLINSFWENISSFFFLTRFPSLFMGFEFLPLFASFCSLSLIERFRFYPWGFTGDDVDKSFSPVFSHASRRHCLWPSTSLPIRNTLEKFAIILWRIWNARNHKIWQDVSPPPHITVSNSFQFFDHWKHTRKKSDYLCRSNDNQQQNIVEWKPPKEGNLKCNINAAIFKKDKSFGVWMILRDRDHLGSFIKAKSFVNNGIPDRMK